MSTNLVVYALMKYASASDGFTEKYELVSIHGSNARAFESAQLQTQTIIAKLIKFLDSEKKEEEFQLFLNVKKQYKKLMSSTKIEELNKILADTFNEMRLFREVFENFIDEFTVYFHSVDYRYCENEIFSFCILEKTMEVNEEINADLLIEVDQILEDK